MYLIKILIQMVTRFLIERIHRRKNRRIQGNVRISQIRDNINGRKSSIETEIKITEKEKNFCELHAGREQLKFFSNSRRLKWKITRSCLWTSDFIRFNYAKCSVKVLTLAFIRQ